MLPAPTAVTLPFGFSHFPWPFAPAVATLPCVGINSDPALTRELKGSTTSYRKSQEKRATFITAVQNGATIKEACALVQMSPANYKYWRQTDAEFRRKLDYARVRENFQKDGGWQGDFATYRDTYFKLQYPTPGFHVDMIRRLEKAPAMSITLMLVPPNHGKTTLIEDWINYKLAIDPNHRITVVSKGQGQARKMLGRVQRRMTDATAFGQYVARFGPFYEVGQEKEGKPWTRDYFTVKKADHDERDYSLQTLGWTGQVYGSRVDTLILDDIQTRDNLTSVESMMDKFRLEFLSRPGDEGRVVIVGTRIEVGDFYEQLIEKEIVTQGQLIVFPAIDHNGKPLWPERWSEDKLQVVRRNVGEKAWWCGYQQKPSLSGSATFTEQMVDGAHDEMREIGRGPNNQTNHGLPVVLSLDPALGGGNALTCMAYDDTSMYILDVQKDIGLARTEDILERIEQFAIRYSPNDLVIETVAFQRGLARDDRMEALSRRYGFRIHEHLTHKNKLDPILGVGSMAGSFLRGEFSIPWANDIARTRMEPMCAELKAWRPNIPARILVQDIVMSLWFGWLFVMNRRKFLGNSQSDWKRPGLPYSPTQFATAGYV